MLSCPSNIERAPSPKATHGRNVGKDRSRVQGKVARGTRMCLEYSGAQKFLFFAMQEGAKMEEK
jgi:hypothetical protein